jgi:D-alanyl-lipoteichoic acid acyltransferase DltB (MBOAT superfamily)
MPTVVELSWLPSLLVLADAGGWGASWAGAWHTLVPTLQTLLVGGWEAVLGPLREIPWPQWGQGWGELQRALRHYWVPKILDDRYRVAYFLPLVFALMLLKGRHLRVGVILTGLVFLGYNFGVLYPLFWVVLCEAFFRLSNQFAIEVKRTDVWKGGPPLAAILIILGMNLLVGVLEFRWLPGGAAEQFKATNAWLYEHAWWLWGAPHRPLFWESGTGATVPIYQTIFFSPHLIGTAYFTVRMLQYFTDIKRDGIAPEARTRLNFYSFVTYGPTVMQGPIERFQRFQEEMDTCHTRRTVRNAPFVAWRLFIGFAKVIVATQYIFPWLHTYLRDEELYAAPEGLTFGGAYWVLYCIVFVEIFYLYLEFSGYCDLAVAMSRMFGYRCIENFRMPWISRSLREFWTRWHISLSSILRDYIYIPFGGNRRHVALNLVGTFAICGLWHAPNPQLGIWGAIMGLMVYANQRWVHWTKRIDEEGVHWFARLRKRSQGWWPVPQFLGWLVTMNAFCLSLLVFFHGVEGLGVMWELVRRPVNWVLGFDAVTGGLPAMNAWFGG